MAENKPKNERINTILESAVSEFLEKGYEAASVNSIAKRAGLSKGGFYHHFKSKDEILLAANFKYMEPINTIMQNAKLNHDPVISLRTFIKEYLNYWSMHPRELQFSLLSLYKMIPNKVMWREITDYSKKVTSFFESILIKGILSGKFIKHDPKSRAAALFSSLQGITAFLVMNENFKTEQAEKYFISFFVDEILKS